MAKTWIAPVQDDSITRLRNIPLRAYGNIGGYSTVFMPGLSPSFIVKTSKSTPRVMNLQGREVRALSSFHTEGCERGFIYADSEGIARVSQLPPETSFAELGVSVRKIPLDIDAGTIAFHPPMGVYAVGCGVMDVFVLPRNNSQQTKRTKKHNNNKPKTEQKILKL